MARDTRLWISPLAHTKQFEGDISVCNEWYPWAVTRLGFMLKTYPGAVSQVLAPSTDVVVRIDTKPNRIYITANSGLYLESGFYDLRSYARCAELTYKPALLKYNARIAAYEASAPSPNWWQGQIKIPKTVSEVVGEALVDGQESLSVGCTAKLDTVIALPPCEKTYSNGGYCDPEKIFKKKLAQGACPASKFSGKLRLYVQALYGSKRTDYRVLTNPLTGAVMDYDSLIIKAVMDVGGTETVTEYTLSSQFSKANGIFTTDDYRYFLIEAGTFVRYYPLRISPQAEKLRALLVANPTLTAAEVKRIEAYILSTAVVDMTQSKASGALTPTGQPFYYGWHWSSDGKSGEAVCHEEDNANMRYTARHYRLQIIYVAVEDTFYHQLTVQASNYWWTVNTGHVVYKPLPYTGQMIAIPMVPNTDGQFSGNPGVGSFSATIHVYRDENDAIVPVTVVNSTTTRNDTELVNVDHPNSETQGCATDSILDFRNIIYNGVQGTRSLSVGGDTLSVEYRGTDAEAEVWSSLGNLVAPIWTSMRTVGGAWYPANTCAGVTLETYLLSTGYFGPSISGPTGIAFEGPFSHTVDGVTYTDCYRVYVMVVNGYSRVYSQEIYPDGRYYSGGLNLTIPYDTCSAVYTGKKQIRIIPTSNNNSAEQGTFLCKFDIYTAIYVSALAGVDNSTLAFHEEGPFQYYTPYLSYSSYIPDNLATPTDQYTYKYDLNVASKQTLISTDTPSTIHFFEVDWFEYPFLDSAESAKDNTSGEYRYNSGWTAGLNGKDGYEGDSSIGWS